jgi:hypothetical protein
MLRSADSLSSAAAVVVGWIILGIAWQFAL